MRLIISILLRQFYYFMFRPRSGEVSFRRLRQKYWAPGKGNYYDSSFADQDGWSDFGGGVQTRLARADQELDPSL